MASRLYLHEEFCELLETRNAYYQPPEGLKMQYPAIRYSDSGIDTMYADNRAYRNTRRYDGVVIDPNPDSSIPEMMLDRFKMCNFSKGYAVNNLTHFPFTLYY